MSGVRAALRIARRDAVRAKGRSALVVAMIGVPMLGLAFADVAVRTLPATKAETVRREIGAADLVADLEASGPIKQDGLWSVTTAAGESTARGDAGLRAPERDPDVAAALPPGSRLTTRRTFYLTRFEADGAIERGDVRQVDLHDPMADGLVRLVGGSLPRAAGEAAVSRKLARVLDLEPGDTVTVSDVGPLRVTGIVVLPGSLGARTTFVSTATRLPESRRFDEPARRRWAVTLPPGVRDVDVVPALNRIGMRVSPRSWLLDPPDAAQEGPVDATGVGIVVVVVGLAALEVVLLAGTAFAVGARRKRRELALVAATGGDARDVRRVVLAGGVVLGATAGVLGVAGGVLGVVVLRPWLERMAGSESGPLDLRPLELAAVVLLGAGTALLAAVLPARAAARQPVVGALTGRRGDARLRKRVPAVALAAVASGAALAFWAAGQRDYPLVLVGAVVSELGFVACAPALVTLVGLLAARLPLPLRLAARDAARHRARSGPAVAAVVAAVAGSVAVSVYLASDTERQRRQYEPYQQTGSVRIGRYAPDGPLDTRQIDAAVARLPVRERIDLYDVSAECRPDAPCGGWALELPERHGCGTDPPGGGVPRPRDLACLRRMPRASSIAAGPASLVEWATGRRDARAEQALRDGYAVVFDARWLEDGKVVLRNERFVGDRLYDVRRVAVPAYVVPAEPLGDMPGAVLTVETARRHGLPLVPGSTYLLTSRMPTEREEAAARGALAMSAGYPDVYVERGFRTDSDVVLLVLALAAGLVTLAATAISTGLAAADSRPDLATLAAVGAAPRIRRRLVMAQAATTAALGSALGLLAGLVPAVAVVSARPAYPLTLPWRSLAVSAVAVPLFAALAVGLFTRSRLPLDRRVA